MVDFGSYQTKKELDNLIRDFKNFNTAFRFVALGVYIAFLVYCLIAGMGYLWIHIFLLTITLLYTAFAVVCTVRAAKGYDTPWDKRAAKIYHWAKFAAVAVSAGLSVAGILTAVSHPTAPSILLAVLLPVCLVLQLLFDIAIVWITARVHRFQAAIEQDMEALKRDLLKIALGFVRDAVFKKKEERRKRSPLEEEEEGESPIAGSDDPSSVRAMKKITGSALRRENVFVRAFKSFFGAKRAKGEKQPPAAPSADEGEADAESRP